LIAVSAPRGAISLAGWPKRAESPAHGSNCIILLANEMPLACAANIAQPTSEIAGAFVEFPPKY